MELATALTLILTSSVVSAIVSGLFARRRTNAETLKINVEAKKTELELTSQPFKILTEEIDSTEKLIAFVRKMAIEIANLQNEVMKLKKEKDTATTELEGLRTENGELKKELDDHKSQIETLKREITRLKNLMKAHKIPDT